MVYYAIQNTETNEVFGLGYLENHSPREMIERTIKLTRESGIYHQLVAICENCHIRVATVDKYRLGRPSIKLCLECSNNEVINVAPVMRERYG
jgi:hypothetical protein